MWKRLPFESKMYWERLGRGGNPKYGKLSRKVISKLRKTLKAGAEDNGANVKVGSN